MPCKASAPCGFYLEELHQLGGELSLDGRIVRVSDGLQALAANSPDRAVERQDEPYRRAIVGMYARLAATAWALDKLEAPHPPVGPAPAYASVDDLKADLDTIFDSLSENGAGALARGRLRALRRAVDVFGFHLASLDLRQNSDVHERVVAELVEAGGPRRLSRARRGRPRCAAGPRARQHAAALLAASQLRRGDGQRACAC